MDDARIASRIREQMAVFSGKVSHGLPKVAQRLVREVLYGVQARAVGSLSGGVSPPSPSPEGAGGSCAVRPGRFLEARTLSANLGLPAKRHRSSKIRTERMKSPS